MFRGNSAPPARTGSGDLRRPAVPWRRFRRKCEFPASRCSLETRSALNALHITVDDSEVLERHLLALRRFQGSRLIVDRTSEDVIAAVLVAVDDLVRRCDNVGGKCLVVGREGDRAFLDAPPRVVGI